MGFSGQWAFSIEPLNWLSREQVSKTCYTCRDPLLPLAVGSPKCENARMRIWKDHAHGQPVNRRMSPVEHMVRSGAKSARSGAAEGD